MAFKALDIASMRINYTVGELLESGVLRDPMKQFSKWLLEATECHEIGEPNAMTLATSTLDGKPSARIVLLKGFDDHGFVFYTNYDSRKGNELAENPRASLLFYWHPLQRTIRIEGCVVKVSEKESIEYFKLRPFKSQLAAIASPQSQVIPSKACLKQMFAALTKIYPPPPDSTESTQCPPAVIPRPDWWGGYRVIPNCIEFWQGGRDRLHDRLRFSRDPKEQWPVGDDGWKMERLAP